MEVPSGPVVIGWKEYISLPDWGIAKIQAKTDTGARSSALDVTHLEELPGNRVRFEVVQNRQDRSATITVEADISRKSRVRSSFGRAQDRIFVSTRILIAGVSVVAELGLVNRENMLCRMLLGRKTLHSVFLVDPGRCYLHRKRKKKVKEPT